MKYIYISLGIPLTLAIAEERKGVVEMIKELKSDVLANDKKLKVSFDRVEEDSSVGWHYRVSLVENVKDFTCDKIINLITNTR